MEELRTLAKQLFKLFALVFVLVGIVFILLLTYEPKSEDYVPVVTEEIAAKDIWKPKDAISELSSMPDKVKKGYYLIAETSKFMGPHAENAEDRYSGNNLACANCHL